MAVRNVHVLQQQHVTQLSAAVAGKLVPTASWDSSAHAVDRQNRH
jgi:hypothetical protein